MDPTQQNPASHASGPREPQGVHDSASKSDSLQVATPGSSHQPPSLAEQVAQVPRDPGCYLWKDAWGHVLYVGKAKDLRARMRQYINGEDERPRIRLMMREVSSFDYLVVGSEHEALVLEINLIQQHKPPYNVALKDDKSYPFIAITESDAFPAIKFTRERHRKGTRYFGPYTDSKAARETIDIVRKLCPLCSANCAEWKKVKRMLASHDNNVDEVRELLAAKGRQCFDAHVGRGPGVCIGAVSPEEYAENVGVVTEFLSGHRTHLASTITQEMEGAAANLDFEKAGRYKRRLDTLSHLDTKQQVYFAKDVDADVVGIWREETIAGACIFSVREGRMVRSCEFILDRGMDVDEDEIVRSFLQRYYAQTDDVPGLVDVPALPDDPEAQETWLSGLKGSRVHLRVPQRGEHKRILEMASRNARHALMRYEMRTGYEDDRANRALLELESALALPEPPLRIECFDISTIHGSHTVASMVVFTNGRPDKSQYRRFKIKTPLTEANDVLSMAEVLGRRYAPERMADARFGARPDLLILDGGKPQLNAAKRQLESLGLDIPMAGLAKSDEELFVAWDDAPVVLPSGSPSLYLVKRVRDEAHRFAITYHRELRDKAMTASILDEIEGVGPKRKKALLKAFGSMKQLRQATEEQIAATPGIPEAVARGIYGALRAWDEELGRTRSNAELLDTASDKAR